MGKEIIIQVQETQRVPNRINPRQSTPRHILIKLTKIKHKEQIFMCRERKIDYKELIQTQLERLRNPKSAVGKLANHLVPI